ncbi:MAG: hypothetical protein WA902_13290 [Thermosynechococcaceae cyanobacterium]
MHGVTTKPTLIFSHAAVLTVLLMTMVKTSSNLSPFAQAIAKDHSIVTSTLF